MLKLKNFCSKKCIENFKTNNFLISMKLNSLESVLLPSIKWLCKFTNNKVE